MLLGATGLKAPKSGGRAVKDCRRGGHRSARSAAEEDREGAAKAAWPRSLIGPGGIPPHSSRTGCAGGVVTRPAGALRHAGGSGAESRPSKRTERKASPEHAVAGRRGVHTRLEVKRLIEKARPLKAAGPFSRHSHWFGYAADRAGDQRPCSRAMTRSAVQTMPPPECKSFARAT